MKTLLLSLMVVAFLYLDSGYTITCYSCSRPICMTFQKCPEAEACYTKRSGPLGVEVVKGCTANCTLPASGEKLEYCTEDKCNQ
nr:three-finger toxin [Helicops leopardinus]